MSEFFFSQELPVGAFATSKVLLKGGRRLQQVHGNDVHSLKLASHDDYASHPLSGDGWYWLWQDNFPLKEIYPCIITADCLPVLILGKRGGMFAHAGWRGVQKQIAVAPIVKQLEPYFAYIGPSIQQRHFEVTEEFLTHFPQSSNFHHDQDRGKITFNLQKEVCDQWAANFPGMKVIVSPICTVEDLSFHSYRREKQALRNYHYFLLDRSLLTKDLLNGN